MSHSNSLNVRTSAPVSSETEDDIVLNSGSTKPPLAQTFLTSIPVSGQDAHHNGDQQHRPMETMESMGYVDNDGTGKETVAILLMGVTGSGKSTFISLLAAESVEIGHGLESHTSKTACYSFMDQERKILLFDTPGFNDTYRSDAETLKEIAAALVGLYKENIRLAGIIYLHRITDPRMSGTSVKSLEIIQALCGSSNFKSITVVMNMWSSIDEETAKRRELELRETFWEPLLSHGSTARPHFGTKESALAIVRSIVENAEPALMLAIQDQLVEQKMKLDATDAGRYVQKEMLEAIRRHQEELAFIKESVEEALREKDESLLHELREEEIAAERRVAAADLGRHQLSITSDQLLARESQQLIHRYDRHTEEKRQSEQCILSLGSPSAIPSSPQADAGRDLPDVSMSDAPAFAANTLVGPGKITGPELSPFGSSATHVSTFDLTGNSPEDPVVRAKRTREKCQKQSEESEERIRSEIKKIVAQILSLIQVGPFG